MLNDVVIGSKTYAKMTIEDASTLDDIAVKVIKQDLPDFLLPVKMVNIDGEIEVKYEMGEGTRLEYLPESMTKREFLILLENMIYPFKVCNDWLLDYHNFCLDKKHIIVGKDYSNIRYIYIPDSEFTQSEEDVLNFFRDFVLNINLSDDPVYVMNLYRHLKEKNISVVSVLDYLTHEARENSNVSVKQPVEPKREESKKTSPININKEIVNNKIWNTGKPEENNQAEVKSAPVDTPVVKGEFGKEDVKGSLINNLFGEVDDEPKKKDKNKKKEKPIKVGKEPVKDKPAKGFLGGILGGGKSNVDVTPSQKPVQETFGRSRSFQVDETEIPVKAGNEYADGYDATVIDYITPSESDTRKLTLQLEEDRGYHFPKYVEIDLSRGHATVGRYDKAGNAQADYNFDASFSFISRRHFRIEKNGGEYMIVDVGSGNGTMLNGELLVANMPYTVKQGDRITISKNQKITYKVC